MGSVYRRGKTWWIKFYSRTGAPIRKSAKTDSKRRAEFFLSREIVKEFGAEGARHRKPVAAIKIGEAFDLWKADVAAKLEPGRKSSTVRLAGYFVKWSGREKRLGDLTSRDCSAYAETRALSVAPQSAFREMTSAQSWLEWCIAQGWIETNPMKAANKPSSATRRREGLTLEAVTALINAVKDDERLYPIIVFAYCNGICLGEMPGLRWEHVNIEAGELTIVKGKTEARRATIAMHPRAWEWMKAHARKTGYVLPKKDEHARPLHDQPMAVDTISRLVVEWNRTAEKRGEPRIPGLHIGRNTLATILVQARVPIERVSKILRHSSIATTAKHYAHLKPLDCRDDLSKLPV